MMLPSVIVCIASFIGVVAFLRMERVSLGIPVAYIGSLLLIHVPGAVAHLLDREELLIYARTFTEAGIAFTAVGSVCFLLGVWLSHRRQKIPEA